MIPLANCSNRGGQATGHRQVPFNPVEKVLCYGLFYLCDPINMAELIFRYCFYLSMPSALDTPIWSIIEKRFLRDDERSIVRGIAGKMIGSKKQWVYG
jgi:hypothetical protein